MRRSCSSGWGAWRITRFAPRCIGAAWDESRLLIVGAGEAGHTILEKIRVSPQLGYRPVGFLDDERAGQKVLGLPVLGKVDQLGDIVRQHKIDEVIIALPEASHQDLLSIISRCEDGRVSIKVFPDVFQIMAAEVNVGDLNGLPLLTMRDIALRGWRLTAKRIVDVVLSAIVLVFISPLLMLIALLVKLDSRDRRFIGRNGWAWTRVPFLASSFARCAKTPKRKRVRCGQARTTRAARASARICANIRWTSCRILSTFSWGT